MEPRRVRYALRHRNQAAKPETGRSCGRGPNETRRHAGLTLRLAPTHTVGAHDMA